MNELPSVWASRFCCDLSDKEIDAKTAVNVESLPNLDKLPVEVAKLILDRALQRLFVPSEQTRRVLRELLALCRCYSTERYPDEITFLRNIYASDGELASYEPRLRVTCLTGLPGVGKTAAISAFQRLVGVETIEVDGNVAFELRPAWRMTVKSGSSIRQLVGPLFRRPESLGSKTIHFTTIQRELCTQGAAIIQADELQFLTQGEGNALPARILNWLARLGPPLVYVANYSLLHRLNRRPQEEKHRLLAKLLFMDPDTPDSADWNTFLKVLLSAIPSFANLNPDNIGRKLWAYTFGIRRLVVVLLTEAYVAMRARNARRVNDADVDTAYCALGYAASRCDVEILLAGLDRTDLKRRDLWCPLPRASNSRGTTNIIDHPAAQEYERRSTRAAVLTSLTPAERQVGGIEERPSDRKTRSPARPKATTEDLLEGAAAVLGGAKRARDTTSKHKS